MIAGYYRAREWTEGGLIPESKMAEMGLLELLPELAGVAAPS